MSIALEAKVTALESRVAELEAAEEDISRVRLLSLIDALDERLEKLEQARKPGPKPKDSNG